MGSRNRHTGSMSDRTSDIILIVISLLLVIIVAYPLYYILVASVSNPYDVYAGKTFDNLAVNYADVAKWWV